MRFSIDQHFSAEPEAVVGALTDPGLYATYTDLSKVATPEVIDRSEQPGVITMQLRMRFVAPLSAAARAVIDPTRITWIQQETYDLEALTARVVFHPDNYADRFGFEGGYTFVADSEGTSRRLVGDLRVRMLLVGGEVERALVSGLREHAAEEQPLIERWLRTH